MFHAINIKMQQRLHLLGSASPKGYTIKRQSQTLGLAERHGERLRHYIVGFKSVVMARKVQYNIHPEPILRLERQSAIDITSSINACLLEVGLNTVPSVTIDVLSRLYVPKMMHTGGAVEPLNDGGFHLDEQPYDDMFMLPFSKNIGIVLPYELEYENQRELVLLCQVIDPADSLRHFRGNGLKSP